MPMFLLIIGAHIFLHAFQGRKHACNLKNNSVNQVNLFIPLSQIRSNYNYEFRHFFNTWHYDGQEEIHLFNIKVVNHLLVVSTINLKISESTSRPLHMAPIS